MKLVTLMIILSVAACSSIQGQTAEDSVKATVNRLFEGMKNADTALLRAAFADSAILQTIARKKNGSLYIRTEKLTEFADFVGKQQKGDADERITFETIRIDGPLAMAWTPYQFYYKGQFSHCGVNSFQLVRLNGGQWKIQYIVDTRRKEPCEQ
jgi:hypothetical protein